MSVAAGREGECPAAAAYERAELLVGSAAEARVESGTGGGISADAGVGALTEVERRVLRVGGVGTRAGADGGDEERLRVARAPEIEWDGESAGTRVG